MRSLKQGGVKRPVIINKPQKNMLKKNTFIVALIAALPVLAQDAAPQQPGPRAPHWGAAGEMPAPRKGRADMHKRMLEKFDTDKDGKLSEEEKAAMKAEFARRRAERGGHAPRPEGVHPGNRRRPHSERPEMIERFDADKDGQLNEQEKAAMKAAMHPDHEARSEEFRRKLLERFDTDKDGQLSDAEKEAAKAARPKHRGEREGKRGPRRPRGERRAAPEHTPATLEL